MTYQIIELETKKIKIMSLTEELLEKKNISSQKVPKEKWEVMVRSTDALIAQQLSNNALQVGDNMVDFTLPNALGTTVTLSDYLGKGSVVISFYRGGWCPYCNMELRALQNTLSSLKELDVTLLAISPETPDNSLNAKEKNALEFPVLSDIRNVVAKEIGLVFQMPEDLREVYHSFNLDVPKHNGDQNYELPMPATYIVNSEGVITYAFVPEDYTERADPEEILRILKN